MFLLGVPRRVYLEDHPRYLDSTHWKTDMTEWKIPQFSIGNTSTHSWWIFQPVMLVLGGGKWSTTMDSFRHLSRVVVPLPDGRFDGL